MRLLSTAMVPPVVPGNTVGSQEEGGRRVCCKALLLALAAWNPRIAGTPGMYSFEQLPELQGGILFIPIHKKATEHSYAYATDGCKRWLVRAGVGAGGSGPGRGFRQSLQDQVRGLSRQLTERARTR